MEIRSKLINVIAASFIAVLISGCAPNISPDTYTTYEYGQANKVSYGVVVSKRRVTMDNNSQVGGLAGATAGAAAGSAIGGASQVNIVGAVGGAVLGGVIGNAIDSSINTHQGSEYIIRLDNGQTISLVQTNNQFRINDHVLVIHSKNQMSRMILDRTIKVTHTRK